MSGLGDALAAHQREGNVGAALDLWARAAQELDAAQLVVARCASELASVLKQQGAVSATEPEAAALLDAVNDWTAKGEAFLAATKGK
jgi:hypothetical protein